MILPNFTHIHVHISFVLSLLIVFLTCVRQTRHFISQQNTTGEFHLHVCFFSLTLLKERILYSPSENNKLAAAE